MPPLDVLAVVSEIFPVIKTGGLADVAGALPGARYDLSLLREDLIAIDDPFEYPELIADNLALGGSG